MIQELCGSKRGDKKQKVSGHSMTIEFNSFVLTGSTKRSLNKEEVFTVFQTPMGHDKVAVVSSFQGWICTIKHTLGHFKVSLIYRVSSFQGWTCSIIHTLGNFVCISKV